MKELIISKSSWHYKMNQWFWGNLGRNPGNTLCKYFWQTVLVPVLVSCVLAAMLTVLLVGLAFFGYGIGICATSLLVLIGIVPKSFLSPETASLTFIGISVLVDILIAAIWFFVVYKRKQSKNKQLNGEVIEPNIFVEFVKAQKQKICPFIKFKD